MKAMRAWALGGLLLAVAMSAPAADLKAGQAKAGVCAGCHGPDGNSPTPMFPKLAGQIPDYIAQELADFKSGTRQNPIMSGMAAPLSKADMQNVAAYFGSQKTQPGTAEGSKDLISMGEKLYRGGDKETGVPACMACHGPSGMGIAPRYPHLSGQYAAYTQSQLQAFKSGTRTNDDGTMTRIAARLSDAQIKAVSQYIAGLH